MQSANLVRCLLLRNHNNLQLFERSALRKWLDQCPEVSEPYSWKEKLHVFYRIHGYERAKRALIHITDRMALSTLSEIQSLRRAHMRWRSEILAYFKFLLTNARTEGTTTSLK